MIPAFNDSGSAASLAESLRLSGYSPLLLSRGYASAISHINFDVLMIDVIHFRNGEA